MIVGQFDRNRREEVERRRAKDRAYRAANREHLTYLSTLNSKRRRDRELGKYRALWAKSINTRKLRVPLWANDAASAAVYKLAAALERATGNLYDVDHIVPLKGRLVCGLHVVENLRAVPRSINRVKHNRFDVE